MFKASVFVCSCKGPAGADGHTEVKTLHGKGFVRGLTERSEVTSLRPLLGLSEPTVLALPNAKTNGEPKDSPFVLVGCAIKISNRFGRDIEAIEEFACYVLTPL